MRYFYIKEKDGRVLDNLLKECYECLNKCSSIGKVVNPCPAFGTKRRNGIVENKNGQVFLCCNDTKTTKLFREKVEALSYSVSDISLVQNVSEQKVKNETQKRVNRLVHNLTTLNARNIQEIYALVSQDLLTANINEQIKFIKNEILKNPVRAATAYLRIVKNNLHMRSEFSIYKMLDKGDTDLDIRSHPIRKVILNVLHTFFSDFLKKSIEVKIEPFKKKIYLDYNSIQVALIFLFDNAAKYCKPNSILDITFSDSNKCLSIKFKMESLYIYPDELTKIVKEGHSGRNARKLKKQGDGIGVWRIIQMLKLNNAELIIHPGDEKFNHMGFEFSENTFEFKFHYQK